MCIYLSEEAYARMAAGKSTYHEENEAAYAERDRIHFARRYSIDEHNFRLPY